MGKSLFHKVMKIFETQKYFYIRKKKNVSVFLNIVIVDNLHVMKYATMINTILIIFRYLFNLFSC